MLLSNYRLSILLLLLHSLTITHCTSTLIFRVNKDGFSNYTLEDLFRAQGIEVMPNAFTELTDGSVIVISTVRYGINVEFPAILDEVDIPRPEDISKVREAVLVVRISSNGELMWARRTAILTSLSQPSFSIINNGTYCYIFGVVGTNQTMARNSAEDHVGLVFRYDYYGENYMAQTYGGRGFRFTKAFVGPEGFIAICQAPVTSEPFTEMGKVDIPEKEGLCVANISPSSLKVTFVRIITPRLYENASVVTREVWIDGAISNDASYLLIEAKQTRDFQPRPVQYAINTTSLSVIRGPIEQTDMLQMETKITAAPDDSFVRAFVSLTKGRQTLVLTRSSRMLEPLTWAYNGEMLIERGIFLDPRISPSGISSVVDVHVDKQGVIRVLLSSAENVLYTGNADIVTGENLPVEAPELQNVRPAVVVFRDNGREERSLQINNSKEVESVGMISSNKSEVLYILGKDVSGMVITGIERKALPSPSPSMNPTPSPTPSPTVEQNACIGINSVVKGRKLTYMVSEHPQLRLQLHPLRNNFEEIEMLCHKHKNSHICATAHHVMRINGRALYMHELCALKGDCEVRMEYPINFKGPCGMDIESEEIGITMHAGHDKVEAEHIANMECAQRKRSWLVWLLRTL